VHRREHPVVGEAAPSPQPLPALIAGAKYDGLTGLAGAHPQWLEHPEDGRQHHWTQPM